MRSSIWVKKTFTCGAASSVEDSDQEAAQQYILSKPTMNLSSVYLPPVTFKSKPLPYSTVTNENSLLIGLPTIHLAPI